MLKNSVFGPALGFQTARFTREGGRTRLSYPACSVRAPRASTPPNIGLTSHRLPDLAGEIFKRRQDLPSNGTRFTIFSTPIFRLFRRFGDLPDLRSVRVQRQNCVARPGEGEASRKSGVRTTNSVHNVRPPSVALFAKTAIA